jgi:ribosomal protein L7Ae-like RNA K-turn-binding protein
MGANKVLQLLGLAMRAGKIVSGEELVLDAIRTRKAKLVLISRDASANTKKKISDKCRSYQVELIQEFDRYEIGHAIGKEERVVLGITDEGFVRKIRELQGANTEVIE